jgi:hypothetical protein
MTLKGILKLIAEGRGQNHGAEYQPWILVQDFPSYGQRNRELGWKTGRPHHYFSKNELEYHYILDWSTVIVDIQEQFPLLSQDLSSPLAEVLAIAQECGIRYPTDRQSKEAVVMTTDFVITISRPPGVVRVARTFKPAKDLSNRRTIEKFEIERRYWRARGINWGIVTESELDAVLVENIKWIHKFRDVSALYPLTVEKIWRVGIALTEIVQQHSYTLCDAAMKCDDRLGLDVGRSLTVARHLIATRQWLVDMSQQVHPSKKLNILSSVLVKPGQNEGGA